VPQVKISKMITEVELNNNNSIFSDKVSEIFFNKLSNK